VSVATSAHSARRAPTHTALAAALGKVTSLKDVVVRERQGLVTFERVPLAAMKHFLRALASAKVPGSV
jgi:hypothetical protein